MADLRTELQKLTHIAEGIYDIGYETGTSDRSCEIQKSYERGLNDAWECAPKIYSMSAQGVITVFGGCSHWVNYSASEAIAKMKEYEKQVNPISIDEAINNLKHGSSIPYKRETLTLAIKALEQMKGAKE